MFKKISIKQIFFIGLNLSLLSLHPFVNAQTNDAEKSKIFSFGLWGDMPYKKANDQEKLPAVLKSINASDIAFSIYNGDIKDGSSQCTDEIFTDALAMFNSLSKPVIYIPGDNEWTDCHRTNNGGYDGLERLNYLRTVMYPTTESLGQQKIALEHQGKLGEKYVENTRVTHGDIMFVGLNVPGSNNNYVVDNEKCTEKSARTLQQCEASNAEYLARDKANIDWLNASFELAKQQNRKGIVLVFQADPGFDLPETESIDESLNINVSGYRNFMNQVIKETEQFKGQVLLVHGDTHFFKLDKPLYSPTKMLSNLTRLQTFGSPSLHWVKVMVDPASDNIFSVQPVIVKQP